MHTSALGEYRLRWSEKLGRMVLMRDDGSVWDIGFGDWNKIIKDRGKLLTGGNAILA